MPSRHQVSEIIDGEIDGIIVSQSKRGILDKDGEVIRLVSSAAVTDKFFNSDNFTNNVVVTTAIALCAFNYDFSTVCSS